MFDAYIICQKKISSDTEGYLMLLSKGRENKRKKATGLKVNVSQFKKFWNDKEQKFKAGMPLYKQLNEELSIALKKFEIDKNSKLNILSTEGSFLKFWELKISEIENHNSRIKIDNVRKKFLKFLQYIGKQDVSFRELKPELIKDFQHYLKTAKDPKAVSNNTAIHYLKVLKMSIAKKLEEDPNVFIVPPFTGVKYSKWQESERSVLQEQELDILINSKISDAKMNANRDMFLFQIFAQGMRVSDLLLLRWSNIDTGIRVPSDLNEVPYFMFYNEDNEWSIENLRNDKFTSKIKYRMFKTNALVELPITYNLCVILVKLIGEEQLITHHYSGNYYPVHTFKLFEGEKILHKSLAEIEIKIRETSISTIDKEKGNFESYKEFDIGKTLSEDTKNDMKKLIDFYLEERSKLIDDFMQLTMYWVTHYQWSNQCLNDFVFPHLKNRFFENIDSSKGWKNKLSFEQNKKLLNGEHLYNRQLKQVAKHCGLNTNLTSHVGRHSFVQLLLNEGAPTHLIMDALRHRSLATTDKYIRHKSFDKGEVDYISKIGNKEKYRKY